MLNDQFSLAYTYKHTLTPCIALYFILKIINLHHGNDIKIYSMNLLQLTSHRTFDIYISYII